MAIIVEDHEGEVMTFAQYVRKIASSEARTKFEQMRKKEKVK